MRLVLLFLGIAACQYDYEFHGQLDASRAPGNGQVEVSPASFVDWHCGEGNTVDVEVTNVGHGVLRIEGLWLEGNWTGKLPELPLELQVKDVLTLPLAGEGLGLLIVQSNSREDPRVAVPLNGRLDEPPTLSVVSPLVEAILPTGPDVTLRAIVEDDRDPGDQFEVTWSSDIDGPIGTAQSTAAGHSVMLWPWARTEGLQSIKASTTDSCGNRVEAKVPICQQGGFTEDQIDLSDWHFEGSASWDVEKDWLELTPAVGWLVGTAFDTAHLVPADDLTISYSFYIGDGSGADGISLTAIDTARMTTYLGGVGCGIGYGGNASCTGGPGLPGWSIEVDTYYNSGVDMTAEDHLMFTFDGDLTNPAIEVVLPEMEDTGWHEIEVVVRAPHVTVSIDGVTYIDEDLPGFYEFDSHIGFTAGTGGATNQHLIDSLQVEEPTCAIGP